MILTFRKLHPHFAAEVSPVDLRRVVDAEGEHATQPEFVYRHAWHVGDLVIWDNRATMHRARPFEDARYRRELRRVTTLDVESPALVAGGS
jgi:alpha-ketoglutarate-dependent 2,4-dichlorophenoxyacetate dioxygenase